MFLFLSHITFRIFLLYCLLLVWLEPGVLRLLGGRFFRTFLLTEYFENSRCLCLLFHSNEAILRGLLTAIDIRAVLKLSSFVGELRIIRSHVCLRVEGTVLALGAD